MLHAGRVEGRPPAFLVVPRELEIVALAGHADGDVADAGPRIEPCAQSPEGAVVRGHCASGEAERRHQESTARVEHAGEATRAMTLRQRFRGQGPRLHWVVDWSGLLTFRCWRQRIGEADPRDRPGS